MSEHYEGASLKLNAGKVIEIGGTAVGKDSITLGNTSSEPGAAGTNQVEIYAKDDTAAKSTLGLRLEADPLAIGVFTASHKIPVWINGVEYHIQLDAV